MTDDLEMWEEKTVPEARICILSTDEYDLVIERGEGDERPPREILADLLKKIPGLGG